MGLFSRKVKLEVTDTEKAEQDFIKKTRDNPPSTQKCYKVWLRYHKLGDIYSSNLIYCLYQGRLLRIPRRG